MDSDSNEIFVCQLQDLNSMALENSILERIWQLRKRVPRWTRNRIHFLTHNITKRFLKNKDVKVSKNSLNLKPGDMVRIKSKEEILQTLDGWKRYKGCMFMDEMWQYCGGIYKVLKKVNHMLDERDMKVKKCKDMLILEGLICQGSWPFKECDRSCFFFWKETWLEKVN
jgi:hypothetical protein